MAAATTCMLRDGSFFCRKVSCNVTHFIKGVEGQNISGFLFVPLLFLMAVAMTMVMAFSPPELSHWVILWSLYRLRVLISLFLPKKSQAG